LELKRVAWREPMLTRSLLLIAPVWN